MLKNILFLLCVLTCFCEVTEAKVLIITHAYNRPDFIEIQAKTFQKFLQDEYEFVVFNDSPDPLMHEAIRSMCSKWNIVCIPVPQSIHSMPYLPREEGDPLNRPNIRHVNCIQYSLDTLGFNHQGIVAIVDSDIFLVRPLALSEFMKDVEIAAVMRDADNSVYYLWPGLTFLAMDRLPNRETLNFNCGKANGAIVDSGGHTYYYLTDNPSVKLIMLSELFAYQLFCPDRFAPDNFVYDAKIPVDVQIAKLKGWGFNDKEIKFLQQKPHTINYAFNNTFLHYRAGTNYDNQSQHFEQIKTDLIRDYIADILAD